MLFCDFQNIFKVCEAILGEWSSGKGFQPAESKSPA